MDTFSGVVNRGTPSFHSGVRGCARACARLGVVLTEPPLAPWEFRSL